MKAESKTEPSRRHSFVRRSELTDFRFVFNELYFPRLIDLFRCDLSIGISHPMEVLHQMLNIGFTEIFVEGFRWTYGAQDEQTSSVFIEQARLLFIFCRCFLIENCRLDEVHLGHVWIHRLGRGG